MKTICIFACFLILVAGCKSPCTVEIPSEAALLAAASANGKYTAIVERYDPEERIAVVQTPGWQPKSKPYQFDGKSWIPLWSPYASPELEASKEQK